MSSSNQEAPTVNENDRPVDAWSTKSTAGSSHPSECGCEESLAKNETDASTQDTLVSEGNASDETSDQSAESVSKESQESQESHALDEGQESQTVNAADDVDTPEEVIAKHAYKGLPQACLFVASLSSARTDAQLQESVTEHFQKWGNILNVKVLKDWMQRPFAFVQFEKPEEAQVALVEAPNTVIDNRHIRVEQAKVNRTLFIAKLPRAMQERELRKVCEKFGPVEDINLLKNYDSGKSKGCAFVKFAFREDAIRAYLSIRQNYNRWVVEWASNLENERGHVELDKTSIFVGQLNQEEVNSSLLMEKFGKYGDIASCHLVNRTPHGPNSRPAFAFIQYEEEGAAEAAVKNENGTHWLDKTIRVSFREVGNDSNASRNRTPSTPFGVSFYAAAANAAVNAAMNTISNTTPMYPPPPYGQAFLVDPHANRYPLPSPPNSPADNPPYLANVGRFGSKTPDNASVSSDASERFPMEMPIYTFPAIPMSPMPNVQAGMLPPTLVQANFPMGMSPYPPIPPPLRSQVPPSQMTIGSSSRLVPTQVSNRNSMQYPPINISRSPTKSSTYRGNVSRFSKPEFGDNSESPGEGGNVGDTVFAMDSWQVPYASSYGDYPRPH